MSLITAFLLNNWKLILGAGVIIAAIWYVQNLRIDNAKKDTKIVTLTNDNKTLIDNSKKLKDGIKLSNDALAATDEAAKDASTRFAILSAANSALRQQQANTKRQLEEIIASKEPSTCTDSISYLIANVKGYSK